MKAFAIISTLVLAAWATGCGPYERVDGACAGAATLGSWRGSVFGQDDDLTFGADCRGTSSYCQATFDFPPVMGTSAQVLITVDSTNSRFGCLPVGATSCSYTLVGDLLNFSCGGVVLTYERR